MRAGPACCMPRVVENQRDAMTRDPVLALLSQPKPVKYAGAFHAPNVAERREHFNTDCGNRKLKITYPDSGIQLDLVLTRSSIEGDVVTIDSRFILNGVCVIWHGAISRVNLEGTGILQLDAEKASEEEARMRDEQRRAGQRLHGLLRQFLPAVPPDP